MEKSGWQLKEGQYRKTFLNEDELWKLFNNFLSTKSVKNTAYKFIFMRSLLLNLNNLIRIEVLIISNYSKHSLKLIGIYILKSKNDNHEKHKLASPKKYLMNTVPKS